MCLTFPGKVIVVDGADATVRVDGQLRHASTLAMPDVVPGDRVIVAAGSIVSRLDPNEADEIERLVRTAFDGEGVRQ